MVDTISVEMVKKFTTEKTKRVVVGFFQFLPRHGRLISCGMTMLKSIRKLGSSSYQCLISTVVGVCYLPVLAHGQSVSDRCWEAAYGNTVSAARLRNAEMDLTGQAEILIKIPNNPDAELAEELIMITAVVRQIELTYNWAYLFYLRMRNMTPKKGFEDTSRLAELDAGFFKIQQTYARAQLDVVNKKLLLSINSFGFRRSVENYRNALRERLTALAPCPG